MWNAIPTIFTASNPPSTITPRRTLTDRGKKQKENSKERVINYGEAGLKNWKIVGPKLFAPPKTELNF